METREQKDKRNARKREYRKKFKLEDPDNYRIQKNWKTIVIIDGLGGKCFKCSSKKVMIHHKIKGLQKWSNLELLCFDCHCKEHRHKPITKGGNRTYA